MRNAGLDEAQAGLKIAGRKINNLRYADDTTFMAESEEKLKSLLMKVKEKGIPDHLTCLLRNLYAGQEATVRTGHGTKDWFQIRKGVHQGCILYMLCTFIKLYKFIHSDEIIFNYINL